LLPFFAQVVEALPPDGGAPSSVPDGLSGPPPAPPERAWHWEWQAWRRGHDHMSYEVEYAPVWYRPMNSAEPSWARGSEIALGSRSITHALPFLLSLSSRPSLRILDSQSFALSLVQTVSVSLTLGPLEPEVAGGFSVITGDIMHGHISAELLSPRAAAGLWLHFGRLRLGSHAYGEVLWRWFGNESFLLRGIAFELGLEKA
jgi:hypothetical protein